tara:strand:- start:394 stop:1161 length:768 start_codon:yes stop_codon:yes gene_type:complete
MIIGEGAVFVTLVLVGSFFIRKYVLREHRMAHQERNFLLATTHELNSPIAAAKLNLQTLRRAGLNDEQKSQMIDSGLSNVVRLEKLVLNILTASRIDAGKFQLIKDRVNLEALLKKITRRHSIQLQENNMSVLMTIPSEIELEVDEGALELVFENLLFNAIKYAKGADFGIIAKDSKRSARIEVFDTGNGVDVFQLKLLFKKFYRVGSEETRSQKGTGLGLYLVKEVIGLHQGSITAMKNDPSGLRFIIDIPHNK